MDDPESTAIHFLVNPGARSGAARVALDRVRVLAGRLGAGLVVSRRGGDLALQARRTGDAILLGQGIEGFRPRPLLDRATWNDRMRRARSRRSQRRKPRTSAAAPGRRAGAAGRMVAAFREAGPAFP